MTVPILRSVFVLVSAVVLSSLPFLVSCSKTSSSFSSANSEAAIDALHFYDEFEQSQTQAEAKYVAKKISITGTLQQIGTDSDGKPFVIMRASEEQYDFYRKVLFFFDVSAAQKVESLQMGQTMTLTGIFRQVLPSRYLKFENSTF